MNEPRADTAGVARRRRHEASFENMTNRGLLRVGLILVGVRAILRALGDMRGPDETGRRPLA